METNTEIYFYGLNNNFGYMSNFYKTNFIDEKGIKYNCSEQYLMYHKCLTFDSNNGILLEKILTETSPTKIKKYGRQVNNFDDIIWNEKRKDVMIQGLRLKFNQNVIIKQKLLETGTKMLYEASKYDKIWGIGFNANEAIFTDKTKFGKNLLGQCLMVIRNK